MSATLVIRFSSLGDLCLLGWALAQRRDALVAPDNEHITLVTKPMYADLMSYMRGVDETVSPQVDTVTEVARLAKSLRAQKFATIIDAHHVLRGHLLLGLMGRRADHRLAKDTASRLLFLGAGKRTAALKRTMIDRFAEILAPGPDSSPVAVNTRPPLRDLSLQPDPASDILGLAPGAQWPSKQWPAENYATVARDFLHNTPARIRLFLGPREDRWFPLSPLATLAADPRVEIVQGLPLVTVAKLMGECKTLVTNDSGLLHLAEAVGTPVLALFGPTVREFGYFPHLTASKVMEIPLECRPCSRNGKRPCHRGDLACLTNIQPPTVQEALQTMWSEHQTGPRP